MKLPSLPLLLTALLGLPAAAGAQSNAESDLLLVGDRSGGPLDVTVEGVVPSALTYLLPSFDRNGSNYLVGLSGDPNDVLAIGIGLAQGGTLFTKRADAQGVARFNLSLPGLASLLDRRIHFQAFSATGPTSFEKFSNLATLSVNQANRWQALPDAPLAVANLAAVAESEVAAGVTRLFVCGGGPYLLTDENTPYPTSGQAWRWDTVREDFTLLPGSMQDSRAFHNVVRLNDGRFLTCGGVQGPYGSGPYHTLVLGSGEVYDPAAGTWTTVAPLSTPRAGSTASLLPDGRVLVAGGTRGDAQNRLYSVNDLLTTSLRSTEIYDPVTDTWTAGPNMAEPKAGAVAVTLDDQRVMIAGGVTFTTVFGIPIPDFSEQVSFYDPASNSFQNRSMRNKRALFGMSKLADGRVLCAGGAGGDIFSIGPIKKTEIYDPVQDSFTNLDLLDTAVAFSGCVALPDGRALIVGGASGDLDDPVPVRNCWLFDPVGDTITALPMMAAAHGGHATVFAANGNVAVLAGESDSGTAEVVAESLSPGP